MTDVPMTCEEARQTCWPLRQPKLVAGRLEAARIHLETCQACQDFLAHSEVLADCYEQLVEEKAPFELKERVFDAIAHERAGRSAERTAGSAGRGGFGRIVRVAAVGLIALGSGAVLTRATQNPPVEPSSAIVDDYLRRAVGQERINNSDPRMVGQWLARELGLEMPPIQFAGLDLQGAEICLLDGERGAMIRYKKDGVEVSHYLVPRRGAEQRDPALGVARGTMPPLVTWATESMEQALVGDLDAAELLALARSAF